MYTSNNNFNNMTKCYVPTPAGEVDFKEIVNNIKIINYCDNPHFHIWQRGTSFSNPASFSFSADRIVYTYTSDSESPTALPNTTITRENNPSPTIVKNSKYVFQIAFDGASDLGTNGVMYNRYSILNGVRKLAGAGKKLTVRFKARAVGIPKIGLNLQQAYGTGGSPSTYDWIKGGTIALTSTFKTYRMVFDLLDFSSKTFGTDDNDVISIMFNYAWGATRGTNVIGASSAQNTVAGYVQIAELQFLEGDIDTPDFPTSIQEDLTKCQYFCEKSYNYNVNPASATTEGLNCGSAISATNTSFVTQFKVTKRTKPTITLYSTDGTYGTLRDITASANISAVASYENTNSFRVAGTGMTTGNFVGYHWIAECEV